MSRNQNPTTVTTWRWAPEPVIDALVYRRREEESLRGELPMPISPREVTKRCNDCALRKEGQELLNHPKLQINVSTPATQEGTAWPIPWEWGIPGRPWDTEVAATSLQEVQGKKKLVHQNLKFDILRVHPADPLPDGGHQHPEIMSCAGQLEGQVSPDLGTTRRQKTRENSSEDLWNCTEA